jgi:hypothetical protein
MAFDDITCDLRSVARSQVGRHAETSPDNLEIGGLLDCDGEARVFEMAHPARAAPAIRILVNEDIGSLGEG